MDDATRADVEAARNGDASALDSLLRRHLPGLHAFVRLRADVEARGRESVSDLVQSTCREVLHDLEDHQYKNEAEFRRWLYAAALSKIVDKRRYNRAVRRDVRQEADLAAGADSEGDVALGQLLQTLTTPSRRALAREDLDRFAAAFRRLPAQYQDVIVSARLIGLPHAEIARQMGRSPGAVRVFLSRAVKRLSELMAERA